MVRLEESKLNIERGKTMYYYIYDLETKEYLGCQWSDTPIENATTISPFDPDPKQKFDGRKWIPSRLTKDQQQIANGILQQAQFQVSQQKLNSQIALQLAQLTAKEAK